MTAFVCECYEDNERFIKEMKRQKLKVNVVRAPTNNGTLTSPDSYRPRRTIQELGKWGFVSYLRELIDAPDAVMAYLCKQYRIYDIPVGSEKTRQCVQEVTSSANIDLFFIPTVSARSPGARYQVRRSKYSSNKIVANSALRSAEYLNIKVNPEDMNQIELQIQQLNKESHEGSAQLSAVNREKQTLEKRDNEFRNQKKELMQQKNRRRTLENKIMLKKQNLEEVKRSAVNMDQVKSKTQQAVSQLYMDKQNIVIKFVSKIETCVDGSIEKGIMQIKYAKHYIDRNKIESQIREINLTHVELHQEVERAETAKVESQQQAKRLLGDAKKKTGGSPSEALTMKFENYPSDLSEIEAQIHEYQARIDCAGNIDPKAFDEYNARKKEIAELEKRVSRMDETLQTKRSRMEEVRDRWLNPLKEILAKVNERFAKYFANMGCAGEVDLYAEDPNDFDKYGVRIRVKFRANSALEELTPFRQSGGERSVATMLYLVALQGMYACPFRLVDEINQGMDPHNERRVFEVIVNSSAEEGTSQYFLITPKLLPNLTYNKHMSVHCVYNGPDILRHVDWKLSRFIRKRKKLRYADDEE